MASRAFLGVFQANEANLARRMIHPKGHDPIALDDDLVIPALVVGLVQVARAERGGLQRIKQDHEATLCGAGGLGEEARGLLVQRQTVSRLT